MVSAGVGAGIILSRPAQAHPATARSEESEMTAVPSTPAASKPASRRALLAGALGGVGALAASAIGRASPVRAGVDGDVILNQGNGATLATSITIGPTFPGENAFVATAKGGIGLTGNSDSNYGIHGTTLGSYGVHGSSSDTGGGVRGEAVSGYGVYGSSNSNFGVYGTSNSTHGVFGSSNSTGWSAALGWSSGNSTGVQGVSGDTQPAAKANTGVYGYATQDSTARGVIGETTAGHGVHGIATTGYAGYFDGKVYTNKFYELTEIAAPVAPGNNRARVFLKDNGSGKTQLCVKFANGTVTILATEG
jgi:hypothetical protein